jgi:hypothetical protein
MSLEPDDAPLDELRRVPRDRTPPPGLEARTLASLRSAGLVGSPRRSAVPGRRWLLAAGLGIAVFAGGLATGRSAVPRAPAPTWALLLYGGATGDDSAAHAIRAAEYSAWASAPHPAGRVVGGEALGSEGIALFRPDTSAFGGVAAAVTRDAAGSELVGFFLVSAPHRQAALQLARDCPHLKYGGRVVVRRIERDRGQSP